MIRHVLTILAFAQFYQVTASGQNLITKNADFEKVETINNPWGGVAENDELLLFRQNGKVVLDTGSVKSIPLSISVSAADFNGDKAVDILAADARGYVWLFPNVGTPKEPKFDYGEIAPIWFRSRLNERRRGDFPSALKLHVLDYSGDGLADFVVGTFFGQIYFLTNSGSLTGPRFQQTGANARPTPTMKGDRLWSNFLAPSYHDFDGDKRRDLIVGEGSYSANNVWLFTNNTTDSTPNFTATPRQVLIRGFGSEHLTPAVVDWNADGKDDVLVGTRKGKILVYINNSKLGDDRPWENRWVTHDTGEPIGLHGKTLLESAELQLRGNPIKFGNKTSAGSLVSVSVADMNTDGLFDLLIGNTDGKLYMAINKGSSGKPKFPGYSALTGRNPYPKLSKPQNWQKIAPEEGTYCIMRTVSSDPADKLAYEEGFLPALDSPGNKAVKLMFVKPAQRYFQGKIEVPAPANRGIQRPFGIQYSESIAFKPETKYEIIFDIKGSGWFDAKIHLYGRENWDFGPQESGVQPYRFYEDLSFSTNWSRKTVVFEYKKPGNVPKKIGSRPVKMSLTWEGLKEGELYLDNVKVVERK